MAELHRINDYLDYERDEFSLVDEVIVVWRPVTDKYGNVIGRAMDIEKTRRKAKEWVEENTFDGYPSSDIEKDTDTIMSWIKNYYEVGG